MWSRLSGVGTKYVNLKVSCTNNLPLFSERTKYILADGVDFESLQLLFNCPSPAINTCTAMQPGFVALVDFISDKGTIEDTSKISLNNISISGVKFLGSGAFSSAYRCELDEPDGKTPVVLKMSKNWNDCSALKNELEALKALKHDAIPKLFKDHLVELKVEVRCERNHVRG